MNDYGMGTCVCCGAPLTVEGTLICWECEHPVTNKTTKKMVTKKEKKTKKGFFSNFRKN